MFGYSRTVFPKFYSSARRMSSLPHELQRNIWKKSNIAYITYVLIAALAAEVVYGSTTNFIWDSYNHGKQYHQVDWSKFKFADGDDEEEEEEEEEE